MAFGADILIPESGDAGLDGNALGAGLGKNLFLIIGALAVEALHAGHGDDADTGLASGSLNGVLEFGASRKNDGFEGSLFLLGNVSASAGAFAASSDVELLLGHHLLAGKNEGGRSVGAEKG